MHYVFLVAFISAAACAASRTEYPLPIESSPSNGPLEPTRLRARPVFLPGARGVVHLDYLAVDRARGRVWVPAGETGSVDVIDTRTDAVTRIGGFRTSEDLLLGKKITVGPSAVALAPDFAYIGNRGDGTICAVDAETLQRGACFTLGAAGLAFSADGLAYASKTKELWVTTGAPPLGIRPRDHSVVVFDASNPGSLAIKSRITLQGAAEGYAVDDLRGVFYTNLEDADRTVAIDMASHRPVATWQPGCGPKGPRGLALDQGRNLLFVACTDRVVVLDGGGAGAKLGELRTGAGVDNIDYVEPRRELFVAAADVASLTVIRVGARGTLTRLATGETARFARVVVADEAGRAYVADPAGARILVFDPP